MMRQSQEFYDDIMNSSGALTARLSEDAEKVAGLTGPNLGNIFRIGVSIAVSLGSALAVSWKMTLAVLAVIPVLILASFLNTRFTITANNDKVRKAYALASQTSCDAIANIRTVKALQVESRFVDNYAAVIEVPHQAGLRKGYINSFGFGFAQGIQFWFYSITFFVGYLLIQADQVSGGDLVKVLFSLIFGAISISSAATFGPDIEKAKVASINFVNLINRVPAVDQASDQGVK